MRPTVWVILGVVSLALAAVLVVGAFTRFSDEPEPPTNHPDFPAYQQRKYDEARLSVVLGLAASFALLGGAACLQQARRGRTSP